MAYTTREAYLNVVMEHFRPDFTALGYSLPQRLRVTCGWPSTGALAKARTIGECWYAKSSADGTVEIFISPYLADPVEVGETLLHELVHAAVGPGFGHKGPFKELALKLGMVGPMRSTRPGTDLRECLNVLSMQLGPYPHAVLNGQNHKKQGTRLIQCVCPACGYIARITKKWIKVGLPLCPCGEFLVPAVTIEGEEE